jgi:hypothetical protein
MLFLQKWQNAGKMELALSRQSVELSEQQQLVKQKNVQMQSLHKNIRILKRTLAGCSDVMLPPFFPAPFFLESSMRSSFFSVL